MTRTHKGTMLLLFALFILFGCASGLPNMSQSQGQGDNVQCPNQNSGVELNNTIRDLSVINPANIAAIAFTESKNGIFIAYQIDSASTGQIDEINLTDGQILNSTSLAPVTAGNSHFVKHGNALISAIETQCETPSFERCWKTGIWDSRSGRIEWDGGISRALSTFVASEDGQVIFRGAMINSLVDRGTDGGIYFGKSHIDRSETIVTSSLTEDGRLLAIGIEEQDYLSGQKVGELLLQEWTGRELRPPVRIDLGPIQLNSPFRRELNNVPLSVEVAPNNKWLGVLTDDTIHIFETSTLKETSAKLLAPFSAPGGLVFNQRGSQLAIGHSRGITILSVPKADTLFDVPGAETTAIAFSSDGCLLAWGDVEGTVHIINAPKP